MNYIFKYFIQFEWEIREPKAWSKLIEELERNIEEKTDEIKRTDNGIVITGLITMKLQKREIEPAEAQNLYYKNLLLNDNNSKSKGATTYTRRIETKHNIGGPLNKYNIGLDNNSVVSSQNNSVPKYHDKPPRLNMVEIESPEFCIYIFKYYIPLMYCLYIIAIIYQ